MSDWWSHIKYFKPVEFRCKCNQCHGSSTAGVANLMSKEFILRLDMLRARLGSGISVTSGYRCPDRNEAVSNTGRAGPHTTARAADLDLTRARGYAVLKWLEDIGFSGVGFQQKGAGRFIHLDDLPRSADRPRPTIWSY